MYLQVKTFEQLKSGRHTVSECFVDPFVNGWNFNGSILWAICYLYVYWRLIFDGRCLL